MMKTLLALMALVLSVSLIAACGDDVVAPSGDSGANLAVVSDPDATPPETRDGSLSPGYWKTHAASWPVDQLEIGGVLYGKESCLDMLNEPARGDHTATLCRQLVAAKLNLANGCDGDCVFVEVLAADSWFAQVNLASGTSKNFVPMSDRGRPLSEVLDDYNNGLLCAPAASDD